VKRDGGRGGSDRRGVSTVFVDVHGVLWMNLQRACEHGKDGPPSETRLVIP
jgi:hypothetical protein